MKKMNRNELLEALAEYGYEFNKPLHHYNPIEVLLNLVNERDSRLLEGFPIAYRNMLDENRPLDWQSYTKELLKDEKKKLLYMLMVSYLLFRLYGEEKWRLQVTEDTLNKLSDNWKGSLKDVEDKLNRSDIITVTEDIALSAERLKNQFRNYVVHQGSKDDSKPKMSMELEVLLSHFFAPKQKELLKKRIKGERFSKTEREYFYRVVSKRLRALRNEKLHQFVLSLE